MAQRCLLCYITDRTAFPGDESARRRRLLEKISEAARAGVDYIQLREKDLSSHELESLAREAIRVITSARSPTTVHRPLTTLLINSRTDVALAAGAHGVHLRSDDVSPREVREIWMKCNAASSRDPLIGVSCHTLDEVAQAAANDATFAVFGPVFEKKSTSDAASKTGDAPRLADVAGRGNIAGLDLLKRACQAKIPVLALGGVTLENAASCLAAGAAGIAAIRLFQENDAAEVVRRIRDS